MHLISGAGPHPYFELIGAHTDRERFDVRLGTVGPPGALHEDAARMELPSFALGATARASYPRAVIALARRLRRERIDVLQTHLLDASVVGLLAARLGRTPVSIFTGHHSHEIPLQDKRSLTAVDRACARSLSDAIIAPSGQMRDTLVRMHRIPAEKVWVIHHGFELGRLDPATVSGAGPRREWGLEGRVVLTAIGRIHWIKNQQALVRAFGAVAPAAPDAVLLLVGAGDAAPLRELARSLGIEDRVRVLPATDDVPELLAATDLFVHPALAESFGMVLVEAMAMAVPVLSTPVGIVPEVMEDGRTGIVAAGGSADELRDAIERALSLRQQWAAMGQEARRGVREYRADAMVSAYEQCYLDLLEGRRAPRPER